MPDPPGYVVTLNTPEGPRTVRVHTYHGPEAAGERARVQAAIGHRWGSYHLISVVDVQPSEDK